MNARVRDGVFELVGETPLVRLQHVVEMGGAEVWAKLESKNPSGSVKDRPALAMILLTIPIFYPMVMALDYWGMSPDDKSIWFGILALMVVEIGLVHPPVGLNVYIINRLAKDVPLTETFKGVVPFLLSDFVRITLLVYFPILSLYFVHAFKH